MRFKTQETELWMFRDPTNLCSLFAPFYANDKGITKRRMGGGTHLSQRKEEGDSQLPPSGQKRSHQLSPAPLKA